MVAILPPTLVSGIIEPLQGDLNTFHATLDLPKNERKVFYERFIDDVHESVIRIRNMDKPVIASVHGAVAGFGLSLANSCDLVIAAEDAVFTMAYLDIGASPDGSGTYSLPRIMGLKRAMEFALLGDRTDAYRAFEVGMVNWVVPTRELWEATLAIALRLAKAPRNAVGRTKRLLNESLNRSLTEQLLEEQKCFAACSIESDFEEGVRAFIEKRKPRFVGADL